MAEYVRKRWGPRFEGMTRHDRQGCSYDAHLPAPLTGWARPRNSDQRNPTRVLGSRYSPGSGGAA